VAYDNIRVVGELGDIYDDQGFIHLNIEADFVIFSPRKGKKLVVCQRVGVWPGAGVVRQSKLGRCPSSAEAWGWGGVTS